MAVAPDGKRLYVWFEAVIGYLSASIEWASPAQAISTTEPSSIGQ